MKIVQAINVMISHPEKITNVKAGTSEDEFFFLYDNKYIWSISKNHQLDTYCLYFYCEETSINELADYHGDWNDINFMMYSSAELKTREAYESMGDLYRLVKEKAFGIDKALDDIISEDIPF